MYPENKIQSPGTGGVEKFAEFLSHGNTGSVGEDKNNVADAHGHGHQDVKTMNAT